MLTIWWCVTNICEADCKLHQTCLGFHNPLEPEPNHTAWTGPSPKSINWVWPFRLGFFGSAFNKNVGGRLTGKLGFFFKGYETNSATSRPLRSSPLRSSSPKSTVGGGPRGGPGTGPGAGPGARPGARMRGFARTPQPKSCLPCIS